MKIRHIRNEYHKRIDRIFTLLSRRDKINAEIKMLQREAAELDSMANDTPTAIKIFNKLKKNHEKQKRFARFL